MSIAAFRLPARLLGAWAMALLLLPARPVLAVEVVAGGTGSSAPLLEILAREYARTAPGFTLRVVAPPMGSAGSLRALATGRVDVAATGRPPKAEEQAGVGQSFELARTPFVLITKEGSRNRGFTIEELAAVYEGKITRWDDGAPLRLILRDSFESDTQTLRRMSADMDRAVQTASERKGMAVAENDLDTIDLVERVPGALAPTALGLVSTLGKKFRVLPLGGVAPSAKALAEGRYPWSKSIFVAVGKTPRPEVKGFVAFLQSPKAREVLLRHEYLPAGE